MLHNAAVERLIEKEKRLGDNLKFEDIFGEDYTRYAAAVQSLIPRLTPYPHSARKPWSFQLFWRENREQYFLLIVLAMQGGMLLKYVLLTGGIL